MTYQGSKHVPFISLCSVHTLCISSSRDLIPREDQNARFEVNIYRRAQRNRVMSRILHNVIPYKNTIYVYISLDYTSYNFKCD